MKKLIEIYELLKNKKLLSHDSEIQAEIQINDITYDSREVISGSLFFCKGKTFKKEYLQKALDMGAVAYVSEIDYGLGATGLIVTDIRKAMLEIAAYFFDHPDKKIKIIGVTGTKGKTTTVKFLKSIFDHYLEKNGKKPCGIISTVDTYDGVSSYESNLTTPEAIPLYKNINNAVQSKLDFLIIEVSSQALKYDRVTNVHFDIGAFLNFGEDHVSEFEHPSIEDYFQSKLKLADLSDLFIFNSKMERHETVKKHLDEEKIEYRTFSVKEKNDDIYAENIQFIKMTSEFTAVYDGQKEKYRLNFPGDYNIENALASILIAHLLGLDYNSIVQGLEEARVEGRSTVLTTDDEKIVCWVNYAHNGLSFQKSFETIKKSYPDYKIVSVFGTPGDRARLRMVDVCNISSANSDKIVIVPEDPGSEDYKDLTNRMLEIINNYNVEYEIYNTRAEGIEAAIKAATEKTILFIAGKGAEKYSKEKGKLVEIEDDVSAATRLVKSYNKLI